MSSELFRRTEEYMGDGDSDDQIVDAMLNASKDVMREMSEQVAEMVEQTDVWDWPLLYVVMSNAAELLRGQMDEASRDFADEIKGKIGMQMLVIDKTDMEDEDDA